MKLFYYKDEIGNFGDDLNPWLWSRLLPDFLDDDASEWFVGIGTLLNHKLPSSGVKHVFGSGYGYGQKPVIDSSYNFICVRGPKTAEALGLPAELALTDSAILVRAVTLPVQAKTFRFGFIPHYLSKRNFTWERLCHELGFNYIDPEWPVDRVLSELGKCETTICEAMHGAIVSDALRIPWIPVRCYDYISAFKWEDWLYTVALPYSPVAITSVYDVEDRLPANTRRKNKLKRQLHKLGFWNKGWDLPKAATSPRRLIDQARQELLAASTTRSYLSTDSRCNSLTERYLEKIDDIRKLS
jgi:succinoglycan biosynthesis protein ExoV